MGRDFGAYARCNDGLVNCDQEVGALGRVVAAAAGVEQVDTKVCAMVCVL
jgi:hypothetical protein